MVETKPKRRRFQFSLRTLLAVVTIFAAGSAWLGAIWHRKLEQRRIVEELCSAGADVSYDYEVDSFGKALPNPTPPGPEWVRNAVGNDVFAEPTRLSNDGCQKEPEILERLDELESLTSVYLELHQSSSMPMRAVQHLAQLRELSITGPMDGHDIVELQPMPQVVGLSLSPNHFDGGINRFDDLTCEQIKRVFPCLKGLSLDARLTDRGIESLSGMQSLETLEIWTEVPEDAKAHFVLHDCPRLKEIHMTYSNCGAGCESLDVANMPALQSLELTAYKIRLRGVPKLRSLNASWAKDLQLDGVEGLEEITFAVSELPAEGFAQLLKCPHLAVLDLRADTNTDRALAYVGRLQSLKKLDLSCTRVTDWGVAQLRAMPKLEELDLSGCEITDVSLGFLQSVKSLRSLILDHTHVSPTAVARIEAAISGLKCFVDLNPHSSF